MFYTDRVQPLISRVLYTPAVQYIRHIDICVWDADFTLLQEARALLVSLKTLRLQFGSSLFTSKQFNFIHGWSRKRRLEHISLQIAMFAADALHTEQIIALSKIPALKELELTFTRNSLSENILSELVKHLPKSLGKILLDWKIDSDLYNSQESIECKDILTSSFRKLKRKYANLSAHLCYGQANCQRVLIGHARCELNHDWHSLHPPMYIRNQCIRAVQY